MQQPESQFAAWDTDGDPSAALRRFLAALIDREVVNAVLVPARQPHSRVVMQSLISLSAKMKDAEPLAPVAWTNGGTLAAALTFKPAALPVAVVLRSCELRAFVELAKLNQANRQDLLLIGVDCFGRFENREFLALAQEHPDVGTAFVSHAVASPTSSFHPGRDVTKACRACEFPVAPVADIRVGLIGTDPSRRVWLEPVEAKGRAALESLGIALTGAPPAERAAAIQQLVRERTAFRDSLFQAFKAHTANPAGLAAATAACINCYNCRVACPVCYCRACVFTSDLFRHDSAKYLQMSRKKGILKMPADTVFYHLTRMVHMSTLCIGCGQCSSACPNDVPVMELFRTVAQSTQARFDYVPGRDFLEPQPMATFHEDELPDAAGS